MNAAWFSIQGPYCHRAENSGFILSIILAVKENFFDDSVFFLAELFEEYVRMGCNG